MNSTRSLVEESEGRLMLMHRIAREGEEIAKGRKRKRPVGPQAPGALPRAKAAYLPVFGTGGSGGTGHGTLDIQVGQGRGSGFGFCPRGIGGRVAAISSVEKRARSIPAMSFFMMPPFETVSSRSMQCSRNAARHLLSQGATRRRPGKGPG